MPKYVIERDIPGAGSLSPQELKALAQKSCNVLSEMDPEIQWVESYITDNKLYCVSIAPDAEAIKDHVRRRGFPADRISRVHSIIDPATRE